ncbi:cell wall protein DAN4-like [Spinacia oleracea]|uniref:Cell wall protein DAN4-like n=1 Tax=Spinacia oleracea TaxID=3562 RepID=A0ABM3QXM5_SPIOL|nr:cell wall protein DAN4-like [Spinacia oleracea]
MERESLANLQKEVSFSGICVKVIGNEGDPTINLLIMPEKHIPSSSSSAFSHPALIRHMEPSTMGNPGGDHLYSTPLPSSNTSETTNNNDLTTPLSSLTTKKFKNNGKKASIPSTSQTKSFPPTKSKSSATTTTISTPISSIPDQCSNPPTSFSTTSPSCQQNPSATNCLQLEDVVVVPASIQPLPTSETTNSSTSTTRPDREPLYHPTPIYSLEDSSPMGTDRDTSHHSENCIDAQFVTPAPSLPNQLPQPLATTGEPASTTVLHPLQPISSSSTFKKSNKLCLAVKPSRAKLRKASKPYENLQSSKRSSGSSVGIPLLGDDQWRREGDSINGSTTQDEGCGTDGTTGKSEGYGEILSMDSSQ